MVGLLTRLRMTLWRNALRTSTPRLVSTVVGGLVALGSALVLGIGLVATGGQPVRVAAVSVALMSLLTLGWWVLSVIASGVDSSLEPRRFAVLPVPARDLAPGLFVAALIGIPGALLVVLALAQAIGWAQRGWAGPAALLAALLGVPTAVLGSRVVTTLLARSMTSRRGRDVASAAVALLTLLPMLLNVLLLGRLGSLDLDGVDVRPVAGWLGWSPVGWAWALPLDVVSANWSALATHAVLAVLLVALLWRAWVALLARELTSPLDASSAVRVGRGRWLPALLGSGVVARIAIRRVRAWRRDARLVSIGLRTLVIPVVLIVQGLVVPAGRGSVGLALLMTATMGGLTLINDLAFDGPAWWMHVAAGVPGSADRWGRVIASAVVFTPVLVLIGGVTLGMGLIAHPLMWVSLCGAFFLTSLGVGALVGAWTPGVAPRPGGSPFAASSGSATNGCLTALVSLFGPPLLCLPVIVTAFVTRNAQPWRSVVLPLAFAWGGLLLVAGVTVGGRRLDRHAPEVLEQINAAMRP